MKTGVLVAVGMLVIVTGPWPVQEAAADARDCTELDLPGCGQWAEGVICEILEGDTENVCWIEDCSLPGTCDDPPPAFCPIPTYSVEPFVPCRNLSDEPCDYPWYEDVPGQCGNDGPGQCELPLLQQEPPCNGDIAVPTPSYSGEGCAYVGVVSDSAATAYSCGTAWAGWALSQCTTDPENEPYEDPCWDVYAFCPQDQYNESKQAGVELVCVMGEGGGSGTGYLSGGTALTELEGILPAEGSPMCTFEPNGDTCSNWFDKNSPGSQDDGLHFGWHEAGSCDQTHTATTQITPSAAPHEVFNVIAESSCVPD